MHYCESGTISGVITSAKKNKSNLAESQIVKWVLQLALAMQYLHDNHVVHRDLKPMNVMLTGIFINCVCIVSFVWIFIIGVFFVFFPCILLPKPIASESSSI